MPVTQWLFTVESPCLVQCWKREAGSALHLVVSCWPLGEGLVTEGQHRGGEVLEAQLWFCQPVVSGSLLES